MEAEAMKLFHRRSRFVSKDDWLRAVCPCVGGYIVRIRVKLFPNVSPDTKLTGRDILFCVPCMEEFHAEELARSREAMNIFDTKAEAIRWMKYIIERRRGDRAMMEAGKKCYLEVVRLRPDGSGIKDFPEMESCCFDGVWRHEDSPADG